MVNSFLPRCRGIFINFFRQFWKSVLCPVSASLIFGHFQPRSGHCPITVVAPRSHPPLPHGMSSLFITSNHCWCTLRYIISLPYIPYHYPVTFHFCSWFLNRLSPWWFPYVSLHPTATTEATTCCSGVMDDDVNVCVWSDCEATLSRILFRDYWNDLSCYLELYNLVATI